MRPVPFDDSECVDLKQEVHNLEKWEKQEIHNSNVWQTVLQVALAVVPVVAVWLRGMINTAMMLIILLSLLIVILVLTLVAVMQTRQRRAS
jgi:hypothetical protein